MTTNFGWKHIHEIINMRAIGMCYFIHACFALFHIEHTKCTCDIFGLIFCLFNKYSYFESVVVVVAVVLQWLQKYYRLCWVFTQMYEKRYLDAPIGTMDNVSVWRSFIALYFHCVSSLEAAIVMLHVWVHLLFQ